MARVGIDRHSGKVLTGWDHCVQSIQTILSTELRERVQRRGLGSHLLRNIDRPQNQDTVLDIYMDVADALEPRIVEGHQYGEPGFVLLRVKLDAGEMGKVVILLSGVFFENGHLGDYGNPVSAQIAYTLVSSAPS